MSGAESRRRTADEFYTVLDERAGVREGVDTEFGGGDEHEDPRGDWVESIVGRAGLDDAERRVQRSTAPIRWRWAAAGLFAVLLAMTPWLWSRQHSAEELTYETAQSVIFDGSYKADNYLVAAGHVNRWIKLGIRKVRGQIHRQGVGTAARRSLARLADMLADPRPAAGLGRMEKPGHYESLLVGIDAGRLSAFKEIVNAWRVGVQVMVYARDLDPVIAINVDKLLVQRRKQVAAALE